MIRLRFTWKLEYEIADSAADLGSHAGGRNGANRDLGFTPGFLDFRTFTLYRSRFAAGSLAARETLIPGFVRNGFFYTRRSAERAALEWAGAR